MAEDTVTAAHQVFNTYELLEDVLLHLPLQDLLLSQRVSKQWQGVIVDSTKIQQALFNTPVSNDIIAYDQDMSQDPDSIDRDEHIWQDDLENPVDIPALNPFIQNFLRKDKKGIAFFGPLLDEDLSKDLRKDEASWKNMYLTQPRCDSIYFDQLEDSKPHFEDGDLPRYLDERWGLYRPRGITLLDFAKHLKSYEERHRDRRSDAFFEEREWWMRWMVEVGEMDGNAALSGAKGVTGWEMQKRFGEWSAEDEDDEEADSERA